MSANAASPLASGTPRRAYTRYSRESQPDPQPTELEIEIVHLLAAGEELEDLALRYRVTRKAMCTRMWRLRQLFGVSSTPELLGLFLSRGWVALPRYEGAPACLRSACESCPIAARLAQLEGSAEKR